MAQKQTDRIFRGIAEEKIKNLGSFFSNPSALRSRLPFDASLSPESTLEVAAKLFARASDDFLNLKTLEELAEIALHVNTTLQRYWASKRPFVLAISDGEADHGREKFTTICVAISDRPFVVDTLTGFLRSGGFKERALLHPVIANPEKHNVSLSYIEFEGSLSEEEKLELRKELELVLNDLVAVTRDFTPMFQHAIAVANIVEKSANLKDYSPIERREVSDFLRWMVDGGFIFLGYRTWSVSAQDDTGSESLSHQPISEKDLGIFATHNPLICSRLEELSQDVAHLVQNESLLFFSRLPLSKPVYRRNILHVVSVKTRSADGSIQAHTFLGLLTSRSIVEEVTAIPIIRRKFSELVEIEGCQPHTYDHKEILYMANTMPKAEFFWFPLETVKQNMDLLLSAQQQQKTRMVIHCDPLERFALVMVVMLREQFSDDVRQNIEDYLRQDLEIGSGQGEFRLAVSERSLVRIHFTFEVSNRDKLRSVLHDYSSIEKHVTKLTHTWESLLRKELSKERELLQEIRLSQYYAEAFPDSYKARTSPEDAAGDIRYLEQLSDQNPIELLLLAGDSKTDFELKIYQRLGNLHLSKVVPILENAGFEVINELTTHVCEAKNFAVEDKYKTCPQSGVVAAVYHLHLRIADLPLSQKLATMCSNREINYLLLGLRDILLEKAENDKLNSLLILAKLSIKQIALLRTCKLYLVQIKAVPTGTAVIRALTNNPEVASTLVEYFENKFNPLSNSSDTIADLTSIEQRFLSSLKTVARLVEDTALRRVMNVIQATVRTNYFALDSLKIALKITCAEIISMPSPRPLFEIFVSSPQLEGVHLRSARIARGGLRWSERPEDFRTEVLGLVKTQIVKNSIIVPAGAKGGFVVKNQPLNAPIQFETVKSTYQDFIRSLLELSDNRLPDGTVEHPRNVVCYDSEDPYLVVAADKGTATFSDTANSIATDEFDYWLGDAFASGGTNGYDHKKLGITAKGAWETVKRHFRELAVDPTSEQLTLVGIGDMSGDVFGNGLLCSKHFKLIAAFNHKHIFIDPDPDPLLSWQERERLFNLPKSQWTDYNRQLVSPGGGIYHRTDKEIPLSPEASRSLGVEQAVVSADELVKIMLRSPVDLIWNGGIGTYIKASTENDLSVGDRANDDVRVSANELKAKVIGEGGNLGLTQAARVEFASLGGRINTDAIDNSGGVDLSDFEVNFKILLNKAVTDGLIDVEERNTILAQNAESACHKVLMRNSSQSLALSLESFRSKSQLPEFSKLIVQLSHDKVVDLKADCLPDKEDYKIRLANKSGLYRPELALLVSHAKLGAFATLCEVALESEPFLAPYLEGYFPSSVVERFRPHVHSHPLKRELIAAQAANLVVETMGATFVPRFCEEQNSSPSDVILAFLAAFETLSAGRILSELQPLDNHCQSQVFHRCLIKVASALGNTVKWLLHNKPQSSSWTQVVSSFQGPLEQLLSQTDVCHYAETAQTDHSAQEYSELSSSTGNKPSEVELRLVALERIPGHLHAIDIALKQNRDLSTVSRLFSEVESKLQVCQLLALANKIEAGDSWEQVALERLKATLYESVARITTQVACLKSSTKDLSSVEQVSEFLTLKGDYLVSYLDLVSKVLDQQIKSLPALMLAVEQLRTLIDR